MIDGFPGVGRPARARRGDDLRTDPARRRRRSPRRSSKRAGTRACSCRASRRSARSSPTSSAAFSEPGADEPPRPGAAARGRRAHPPAYARAARPRLGRRRCAARSAAPTRTDSSSTTDEPALVATTPAAGLRARRRSRRADRRHDHRGRRPGEARNARRRSPMIPTGASPSTSSRSPSPPGRNGSPRTASSTARRGSRALVESGDRTRSPRARAPPRPDDHRRLDRRQPRDRAAHRRHRAGRPGRRRPARTSTLDLDDRAWAMIGASDGERARARRPSAGPAAPADRASSASTRDEVRRSARRRARSPRARRFLSEALRPAEFDRRLARPRDGACARRGRRRACRTSQ